MYSGNNVKKAEFDKFAEEYAALHKNNIKLSGEAPDYFAEYKIIDTVNLIKKHNLPDDLNILDFGSGVGNSVPFFKKHLPRAHLTCMDVSQKSLDMAASLYNNSTEFKLFDGNAIPIHDDAYDLVFTACVFHHIPHGKHIQLFKEIFRIIKPGGLIIIFEHNPLNPLTVHAVNTCEFDENAALIKANTLEKRISAAGFIDSKITYRIFFPAIFRFLRGFERYLTKLPAGAQYYISAIKRN